MTVFLRFALILLLLLLFSFIHVGDSFLVRIPNTKRSGCISTIRRSINKKRSNCFYHYYVKATNNDNNNNESIIQQSDDDTTVSASATGAKLGISLIKSIVGAEALTLPACVAKLGNTIEQAVPTAILFILFSGVMNAYFFNLIGKIGQWTNATSYQECWDKTVGNISGKKYHYGVLITITLTFKTALSCLAGSMIIADTYQLLVTEIMGIEITRSIALLVVTITAILPLCLLRDISTLAPYSFIGVIGYIYTTIVIIKRYIDGSYYIDSGKSLVDTVPEHFQPAFGDVTTTTTTIIPNNVDGIVLLCTLATAFVAHYNAPRFYSELGNNNKSQFPQVVVSSYIVATCIFTIIAIIGFATFGSNSQSLILSNYSPYDPLITIARITVAICLVLTYPLIFIGLRDGITIGNNNYKVLDDCTTVTIITIVLLTIITGLALNITDLSLILSIGGGTFSTIISSVLPTIMFRSAVYNNDNNTKINNNNDIIMVNNQVQCNIALILMIINVIIGIAGVYISLSAYTG